MISIARERKATQHAKTWNAKNRDAKSQRNAGTSPSRDSRDNKGLSTVASSPKWAKSLHCLTRRAVTQLQLALWHGFSCLSSKKKSRSAKFDTTTGIEQFTTMQREELYYYYWHQFTHSVLPWTIGIALGQLSGVCMFFASCKADVLRCT